VALAVLGWMVAIGPWTWLGEQLGAWFWVPFLAGLAVFVADSLRAWCARR
jgi:hypothetical protein